MIELQLSNLVVPQGLLPRIITGTVEEKVDEYAQLLEQGVEFDPISVWKRENEYWVIDGVHRLSAYKKAGRTTIKAKLVECKNELDFRIKAIQANLKHGLALKKEERELLAQILYKEGLSEEEIQRIFGVTDRTIRNWLAGVKEQEKQEKIKKALELREQGLTTREIAEKLGVEHSTVVRWLSEVDNTTLKFGEKWKTFPKCTKVDNTTLKFGEKWKIFEGENLTKEFKGLLNSALEKGLSVREFLEQNKRLFNEEELERFRSRFSRFIEKVVLRTYVLSEGLRKRNFVELLRNEFGLSVKAGEVLYEKSAEYYKLVEKAIRELQELAEQICEEDDVVSEESAMRELKRRLKDNFVLRNFSEFYVFVEEKVRECLGKYLVLTVEDVLEHYSLEDLEKLNEEGLRNELLASFPQYKVSFSVIRELKRRIEEKKGGEVKGELNEEGKLKELLKEFEEGYYSSVGEFEQELKAEDRELVILHNNRFVEILNLKKKGGAQDHIRWAQMALREGLSPQEVRKRAWEEEKILLSPITLNKLMEKLKQEQEEEELTVRTGLKSLHKFMRAILKQVEELEKHIEQGNTEKALKHLQKIKERLRKEQEKIEKKIEQKQAGRLKHDNKVLYNLLSHIHNFSMQAFDFPVIFDEEEGKLLLLLDKATTRYEEVLKRRGVNKTLEKDFGEFMQVFLETYAYAFLKTRLSVGKILANWINFRHELGGVKKQGIFYTKNNEKKTYQEISTLVKKYLGGQENGRA